MSMISGASKPQFVVRYIHGQRCICLNSYTVTSQFVVRTLQIALDHQFGDDISKGRLIALDIMFTRSHMNQWLASVLDSMEAETSDSVSCWICESEMLWRVRHEQCIIGISWRLKEICACNLVFYLQYISLLGKSNEEALDMGYYFADFVMDSLHASLQNSAPVFSFKQNLMTVDLVRLLLNTVLLKNGLAMPEIEGGAGYLRFVDSYVNYSYDAYKKAEDFERSPLISPREYIVPDIYEWKQGHQRKNARSKVEQNDDNSIFMEQGHSEKECDAGTSIAKAIHAIDQAFASSLEYVPECAHTGVVIKPLTIESSDHSMLSSVFPQIQRMASCPIELSSEAYGEVSASETHYILDGLVQANRDVECDNAHAPENRNIQERSMVSETEEYPALSKFHDVLYRNEQVTLDIALHALDEAKEHFTAPLYVGLLYVIHCIAPELDGSLKLAALCADLGETDNLLHTVLIDIYKKNNNYTLLMDLYQREMQLYEGCPHKLIRLGVDAANTYSLSLGYCTAALKRLDAMKTLVETHGSSEEKLSYAQAFHFAQGTSMAIHHLKHFMLGASSTEETALYGYAIVCMMQEHNEPAQAIINACMSVLESVPNHLETLKVLINHLENCGRCEEASFYCERLLDLREHDLEMSRAKARLFGTDESVKEMQVILQDTLDAVIQLEHLFSVIGRPTSRCIALKHHLRLMPDSLTVLSKLLRLLEQIGAFEEMVQICLKFIDDNSEKLEPVQEVSVRLTLFNIYDQQLYLPIEADRSLERAVALAPNDPRVLTAQLDRCRKRGMKREQIALRKALIEVLPPDEAVAQTLALIQLYEDMNESSDEIIAVLRRCQRISSGSREILLELRRYLRKEKRYFELAVVLEKLVPITKDLTSRKSILFEASEAHQHLGNEKRAEELYKEAQLLNPINPDKMEFMAPFVPLPRDIIKRQYIKTESQSVISSNIFGMDEGREELDQGGYSHDGSSSISVVCTSHSLSVVHSDMEDHGAQSSAAEHSGEVCMNDTSSQNLALLSDVDVSESIDEAGLSYAERIARARVSGNTDRLLNCLMESQSGLEESANEPRILQEIGCIYLYEKKDPMSARYWLERATGLSEDVANGELTLNALEEIYSAMRDYESLAKVYETKSKSPSFAVEARKYQILLAQLCYEHLNQKARAIDILEKLRSMAAMNETVLSMLAQMYMDTQQYDTALERLNEITPLLIPDSRTMAQHILQMVLIYAERDDVEQAKALLRGLLDHNEHIDKLAVIEQYKRICRLHDAWEELLDILTDELCYYLHIDRSEFTMEIFMKPDNSDIPMGYSLHTLREYADVLYYKINDYINAVKIYKTIALLYPQDDYAVKMLREILTTHPDSEEALKAFIFVHASEETPENSDGSTQPGIEVSELEAFSEDRDASRENKAIYQQALQIIEVYRRGEVEEAKHQLKDLEESLAFSDITRGTSVLQYLKNYWEAIESKEE